MTELGRSLDQYAMGFIDRTRQLKSLVLLRSSKPSEQTDQILEELEAALVKAERVMYMLKTKIAEETSAVKMAEALAAKSKLQSARVEHCKNHLPEVMRKRLAEVKREEEFEVSDGKRRISGQHAADDKENVGANGDVKVSAPKAIMSIGEEDFEGVPSYLRGRSSTERVNDAITELNGLLSTRDGLMGQHLSKLSNAQLKQVNAWKDLDGGDKAEGSVTLLESDLRATSLRVGEASSKDIINVLRHLHKVRETRAPSGEKAYVCICA